MLLLYLYSGIIFFFHPLRISSVIVAQAHKAQIVCAVVCNIAVNMVNCGFILWVIVLAERRGNQAADEKMSSLAAVGETDTIITFVIGECFQKLRFLVLQAFDSAEIADKVFSIIPFNGFPDFSIDCIHLLSFLFEK